MAGTIEWLLYESVTFEILGVGETREDAIRDALERNFVPGDMGVEVWGELDVSVDASCFCANWVAAIQPEYQQAFEDAVRKTDLA